MPRHDAYAAFRHPSYRWAFSCHGLSILAAQIQATAVGWLIYERTSSAAALGIAGLMLFLPVLLFALPIGYLVDSRSRRAILAAGLGIDIAAALMLAVLSQSAPVSLLFLVLFTSGIGNAFVSVARPVIMQEVIPSRHAENATNWASIGRRVMSVVGPVVAGAIIGWRGGAADTFLLAALLFVAGLLASLRIVLLPFERKRERMTWRSVTQGIQYIRNTPLILSATLLDMFAVLLGGAMGLLPIYAQDILHIGPTGLGWLRAMPSIGSAVMALLLAYRPPMRKAGLSMLLSVAVFGLATIIFGISTTPLLSFAALFVLGVVDAVSVTVRATILQVFVPNTLRGRVYGINMIFIYSSNELGDFESGMVAALVGARSSVVLGGLAAILLAILFGWKSKDLRELGKMEMKEGMG